MEVHLPVSELKAALPAMAKVVSRHSSLPVARMVRVTRNESGSIQIQASDFGSFLAYTLDGQPGEPMDLLVAFEPLVRTVKGCSPTDRITLVQTDGRVSLRHLLAGRVVERFIDTLDLAQWPNTPTIQGPPEQLDESVTEAILRAFACCSDDTTRAAIMGAWLDVSDPLAHYVMGTDGKHMFSTNSFRLELKEPLFIPHQAFLERSEFRNDGPWSLATAPGENDTTGWLQLQSRRWTYITRQLDYTIPKWRQVVPESRNATVIFGEKATAFLLDVLPKLPGKDDPHQPIRLDIVDKHLLVTAGDTSMPQGTTVPVEDTTVTGDNLAITVNRNFALKALKWGLTEMALIDGLSPLVFSAPGRRLVAMPMRTDSSSPVSIPDPVEPNPTIEPPSPEGSTMPINTPIEDVPEPLPVNRLASLPETTPEAPPIKPTIRSIIEQIDGIRDSLRSNVRQFGEVLDSLRIIEKDRKTTDKEVELVREKLRALQAVSF